MVVRDNQMSLDFQGFSDAVKEGFWSKLDDELDLTFDFAKIVVYEINENNAEEPSLEGLDVLCYINRQNDDSPYDALVAEEITWLARHLGDDEAEKVANDFGGEGTQSAIVYAVSYSDDEGIEPARYYLTSFTRSADSE